MNGIPKIIISKIKLQFLEWKLSILKSMSKKPTKPVETTEEKKTDVSKAETQKLEKELNAVELDIIKNIFNGMELIRLNKKKEEILNKLGRDKSAPWKK
jgi:hypothetical protein